MIRRPPESSRTDPPFPSTTLFLSIRIRPRISYHRTRYPKISLLLLGLASGPKDNRPRWESGGKYRVAHVESRGLPRLFAPGGKAPAAAVAAGQGGARLPAAGPVRRHASQRLADRHRRPGAARAADRRAHDGDHARSRTDAGEDRTSTRLKSSH